MEFAKEKFRQSQKVLLKRHAKCCVTPNFRLFKELMGIIEGSISTNGRAKFRASSPANTTTKDKTSDKRINLKTTKAKKRILLFLPLPYEPNLSRFRREFAKKFEIFVPLLRDENIKMVKLRTPFSKGRFGIYEPLNSPCVRRIDLAIVPVLGVDKQLKRVGHGFGFYDRFFQNLGYKPLIIFVSAKKALCEQNLGQKHDIQADFYINPYQKFHKKVWKNGRSYHRIYRRSGGRCGGFCSI